MMEKIIIIGAGWAGLVAAVELFQRQCPDVLQQLQEDNLDRIKVELPAIAMKQQDWLPEWSRMPDPPAPPSRKAKHLVSPDLTTKIHSCRRDHHSKPRRGNRRS